jgi:hypothetical protein
VAKHALRLRTDAAAWGVRGRGGLVAFFQQP